MTHTTDRDTTEITTEIVDTNQTIGTTRKTKAIRTGMITIKTGTGTTTDGDRTNPSTTVVVLDILKDCLLILAHHKQGHNSFRKTYVSLKNRYHWKGIKKSVHQHCTNCKVCAKHNIKMQQLKNEHFSSAPQPMEFIAIDLIGEFHPASSKGNKYALTAVCMLTGFTFCIPLKSKCA